MGWFNDLFRNKARDEALRLGLAVSEVDRELPIFERGGGFELLSGSCVRYALPRISSGSTWELLQRDEGHGANLPNGYLLNSEDITSEFLDRFRPTAEEFSEEYFEFEGSASEVAVFWQEYGGAAQAARLHRALSLLRGI
jgi:hypothetical protein